MAVAPVKTVVRGNPVTNSHQIDPAQLTALLEEIQLTAAVSGPMYVKDTLAGLQAVSPATLSTGFVLTDGTLSNRGVYQYQTDTWVKMSVLPPGFEALDTTDLEALALAAANSEAERAQFSEALLAGRIDAEATARAAGDADLLQDIATEENDRLTGDAALQVNIDAEATARAAGDADLLQDIATEENDRLTGDAALQVNINAEAAGRAAGDAALQANIAAEAAARELRVTGGADGSIVFRDAAGFVALRLDPDVMSVFGKLLLRDFGSHDFCIRDGAGFALLRANIEKLSLLGKVIITDFDNTGFHIGDPLGFRLFSATSEGVKVLGVPILSATVALHAQHSGDLTGVYGTANPLALARWRRARAGVRQGLDRARVAFIGDSNTMGWAVTGAGQHSRALSHPSVVAKILSNLGGIAADGMGRALARSGASYEAYDPRTTIGAGWLSDGAASLGGEMWQNTTTTNALSFLPVQAWDRAEVWVALDTAATIDVGTTGDLTRWTPATGEIVRIDYSAASVAAQTLEIARVSGDVRVIGWSCWDSTAPGVTIYNAGRSGWRTDEYAATGSYYSPATAIDALSADVVFIELGLNDRSAQRPPGDFGADLAALIAAAQPADVVLVVPVSPFETGEIPWSDYVAQIHAAAQAAGVPVVDMSVRLGTRSEVEAASWHTDNSHPNAYGLAEKAEAIAQILTK